MIHSENPPCQVTMRRLTYKSPQKKKRISHLFKNKKMVPLTDGIKGIVGTVKSVCSTETPQKSFKKCKWCQTPFVPNDERDVHCIICRDIIKKPSGFPSTKKHHSKNKNRESKVKHIALKKLTKSEQQRLRFNKSASVDKGYNHCKSFTSSKHEVQSEAAEGVFAVRRTTKIPKIFVEKSKKHAFNEKGKLLENIINKGSERQADTISKSATFSSEAGNGESLKAKANHSKIFKKHGKHSRKGKRTESEKKSRMSKKKDMELSIKSKVQIAKPFIVDSSDNRAVRTSKGISISCVDDGLLLMTFPDPEQGLEEITKNSTSVIDTGIEPEGRLLNCHQQSLVPTHIAPFNNMTNILPSAQAVLNCATSSFEEDVHWWSGVQYPNEISKLRSSGQKLQDSSRASSTALLPSMPSLSQLSGESFQTLTSQAEVSLPVPMNLASATDSSVTAVNLNLVSNHDTPENPDGNNESSSLNLKIESICYGESQTRLDPKLQESFTNCLSIMLTEELNTEISTGHESCNSTEAISPVLKSSENIITTEFMAYEKPYLSNEENLKADLAMRTSNSAVETVWLDEKKPNNLHDNLEGTSSVTLALQTCLELDAICILGIMDLDKNPKRSLDCRINNLKEELYEMHSPNYGNTELTEKKLESWDQYRMLQFAKTLLNRYGSFTKLSESCPQQSKLLREKKFKDCQWASCQLTEVNLKEPPFCEIWQPSTESLRACNGMEPLIGKYPSPENWRDVPPVSAGAISATPQKAVTLLKALTENAVDSPNLSQATKQFAFERFQSFQPQCAYYTSPSTFQPLITRNHALTIPAISNLSGNLTHTPSLLNATNHMPNIVPNLTNSGSLSENLTHTAPSLNITNHMVNETPILTNILRNSPSHSSAQSFQNVALSESRSNFQNEEVQPIKNLSLSRYVPSFDISESCLQKKKFKENHLVSRQHTEANLKEPPFCEIRQPSTESLPAYNKMEAVIGKFPSPQSRRDSPFVYPDAISATPQKAVTLPFPTVSAVDSPNLSQKNKQFAFERFQSFQPQCAYSTSPSISQPLITTSRAMIMPAISNLSGNLSHSPSLLNTTSHMPNVVPNLTNCSSLSENHLTRAAPSLNLTNHMANETPVLTNILRNCPSQGSAQNKNPSLNVAVPPFGVVSPKVVESGDQSYASKVVPLQRVNQIKHNFLFTNQLTAQNVQLLQPVLNQPFLQTVNTPKSITNPIPQFCTVPTESNSGQNLYAGQSMPNYMYVQMSAPHIQNMFTLQSHPSNSLVLNADHSMNFQNLPTDLR